MRHLSLQSGVTLTELMVVVAIIAIIAGLAVPSYQSYKMDGFRSDTQVQMQTIMQSQHDFYSQNLAYTSDIADLFGYTTSTVNAGDGNYTIAASSCGNSIANVPGDNGTDCVLLTASPTKAEPECGNVTLNSSGVQLPASCW